MIAPSIRANDFKTERKQKAEQVSERINHANNLGAQPATRAPDGLILSPPFCARSLLVGLNNRSINHRIFEVWFAVYDIEKTLEYADFRPSAKPLEHRIPFAERFGKVSPWDGTPVRKILHPVRARQYTDSMNSRLSCPVAPGSPAFPGNIGAIFSQSSFEITKRSSSIQASILEA